MSHPIGYFSIGVIREQAGRPTKTPEKQRFPFEKGITVFAMDLKATQDVPVTGRFKDKKGNNAKVQNPQAITSNAEILGLSAVTENADNSYSFTVSAIGPVGPASVSLLGDADLGEGVKDVRLDGEVNVVAGDASVGELTFGTPTEQP